jgi:hypothetical protein
MHSSGEE